MYFIITEETKRLRPGLTQVRTELTQVRTELEPWESQIIELMLLIVLQSFVTYGV